MNTRRLIQILLLAVTAIYLSGCATALVTGAATGVVVAKDRRTAGTFIDDNTVELKIAKQILEDAELNKQTHINATAFNGKVLLTGEAPSPDLRTQVVNIARSIKHVEHVYNEITLAAPSSLVSRSSDTLITTKVKAKLLGVKDFDSTNVKVVTENGVVYLMGLMREREGNAATEVARRISGVQKVVKLFEPPL